MIKKKIAILGSTGSIGKSSLDVISLNKNKFNIILLSGNSNYKEIKNQIKKYRPKYFVITNLIVYEKTVKKLSDEEKNQYHKENMVSAGLVLLNIKKMPQTHEELKNWVITKSKEKNYLILTDVAEDVYEIIKKGPVPIHIKPIWPFIAFTAFNTLPAEFKEIYDIKNNSVRNAIVNFNLFLLKITRPFLPPFFKLIAPARWAKQRIYKDPSLKFIEKAKI